MCKVSKILTPFDEEKQSVENFGRFTPIWSRHKIKVRKMQRGETI